MAVDQEVWRCDGCGQLMYDLNKSGNPCLGAPVPKFFGVAYKRVCTLCFDMLHAVSTTYFNTHAKPKNDHLKPGANYFG